MKKMFTIVSNGTTLRDIILGFSRGIYAIHKSIRADKKRPLLDLGGSIRPWQSIIHCQAASERGRASSYRSRALFDGGFQSTLYAAGWSPGTTMNHIPRKRISVWHECRPGMLNAEDTWGPRTRNRDRTILLRLTINELDNRAYPSRTREQDHLFLTPFPRRGGSVRDSKSNGSVLFVRAVQDKSTTEKWQSRETSMRPFSRKRADRDHAEKTNFLIRETLRGVTHRCSSTYALY